MTAVLPRKAHKIILVCTVKSYSVMCIKYINTECMHTYTDTITQGTTCYTRWTSEMCSTHNTHTQHTTHNTQHNMQHTHNTYNTQHTTQHTTHTTHNTHTHTQHTIVPLTILVMASLLHFLQQIGTSSNIINGTRNTIVPQTTVNPYT